MQLFTDKQVGNAIPFLISFSFLNTWKSNQRKKTQKLVSCQSSTCKMSGSPSKFPPTVSRHPSGKFLSLICPVRLKLRAFSMFLENKNKIEENEEIPSCSRCQTNAINLRLGSCFPFIPWKISIICLRLI